MAASSAKSSTPSSTMASLVNGKHAEAEVMYAANIAQLFLGILITGGNALVLASIITRPRHKTSTNMLLGNICFVNMVVGVMLSVVNVGDGWYEVSLLKTESALVVLDCFINIATLLALITNNFVAIRNPGNHMTAKNCGKIIFGIWAAVLFLCFCKALVFAFDRLNFPTACYRCFVVFEVVTLLIFSLFTVFLFLVAVYLVTRRRKRTVTDQARPAPEERNREFAVMVTAGILLLIYFICFLMFVFMYISWLANHSSVWPGLAEIIVSLFFFHALINPVVIILRHADLRETVKSIVVCGCLTEDQTPRPGTSNPGTPRTRTTDINPARNSGVSVSTGGQRSIAVTPAIPPPDVIPAGAMNVSKNPYGHMNNQDDGAPPASPIRLPPIVEPTVSSRDAMEAHSDYIGHLETSEITKASSPPVSPMLADQMSHQYSSYARHDHENYNGGTFDASSANENFVTMSEKQNTSHEIFVDSRILSEANADPMTTV